MSGSEVQTPCSDLLRNPLLWGQYYGFIKPTILRIGSDSEQNDSITVLRVCRPRSPLGDTRTTHTQAQSGANNGHFYLFVSDF